MTNSEINKVVEYWFCVLERNNKDEKKNKPKMVDDFRLKNSMILKIFRTFISAYILSNLTNFNNLEFLEATSLETNLPIVLQTLYQCQHGLSLLEQISTSSGSTKHEPCFFFFGRMINL